MRLGNMRAADRYDRMAIKGTKTTAAKVGGELRSLSEKEIVSEFDLVKRVLRLGAAAEWDKQVKSIRKCLELAESVVLLRDSKVQKVFLRGMRAVELFICGLVRDKRPQLVRAACETIAGMAECFGDDFAPVVTAKLLPALMTTACCTTTVLSECGSEALRSIVHHTNLSSAALENLVRWRRSYGNLVVADVISVVLDRQRRITINELEDTLLSSIRSGLEDSSDRVRLRSQKNMTIFGMMFPEHLRSALSEASVKSSMEIAFVKEQGFLAPRPCKTFSTFASSPESRDYIRARRRSRRIQDWQEAATAQRKSFSSPTTDALGTPVTDLSVDHTGTGKFSAKPFSRGDWTSRVEYVDSILNDLQFNDAEAVHAVLLESSGYIFDSHPEVVTASSCVMIQLINCGKNACEVLERRCDVVAAVFCRLNSAVVPVKNAMNAILEALQERMGMKRFVAHLISLISFCRSGLLRSGDHQFVLVSILAFMTRHLQWEMDANGPLVENEQDLEELLPLIVRLATATNQPGVKTVAMKLLLRLRSVVPDTMYERTLDDFERLESLAGGVDQEAEAVNDDIFYAEDSYYKDAESETSTSSLNFDNTTYYGDGNGTFDDLTSIDEQSLKTKPGVSFAEDSLKKKPNVSFSEETTFIDSENCHPSFVLPSIDKLSANLREKRQPLASRTNHFTIGGDKPALEAVLNAVGASFTVDDFMIDEDNISQLPRESPFF